MGMSVGRAVRLGAAYDVVTCFGLALPYVSGVYLGVLGQVSLLLGFSGRIGEISPLGMMFVNFLGVSILVWAALRWRNPSQEYAVADCINRLFFVPAVAVALGHDAPGLLWFILAAEIAVLAVQVDALIRSSRIA